MSICTVCGEEVETYWDNGQKIDPTVHILLTKHDPVTGEVQDAKATDSGHADCIEHRRLWDRLAAAEARLDAVIDAFSSSEPSIKLIKNLDTIMRGVQHENSSDNHSPGR